MTPLIISIALLAIAAVGVWRLIRRKQAEQLAEQSAREESERLAAERRLAHEKAMAEVKARDDARLQAEAEELNRKEEEATEVRGVEEEQRLAAEKHAAEAEAQRLAEEKASAEVQARDADRLKAEAEARQRVEAEDCEKARLAAEEAQRAEARRQAVERASAEAEIREKAHRAAKEESRRQEQERKEQPKAPSEPAVETVSHEMEEETPDAPSAEVKNESVATNATKPPPAEDDKLPRPREFSEPKLSPKERTSTTKRERNPEALARTDVTTPIHLQLVTKRGTMTLNLVPRRRDGMPSNLDVTTTNGELRLCEWSEDTYQPIAASEFPDSLSEGLAWQARSDGRRWRWELTRREIYVLAAGAEFGLHGFVTRRKDQRLWLNTRHVVLAKEGWCGQILDALGQAGCASPEVCDPTTPGVPSGWLLFRDVVPTRAVPMREERDPLNVLCPAHEIEPHFVGGVRLERNVWLAGFPPRIRFTGELGNGFEVRIDGQPAQLAANGAFEVPGWDAAGEHRLWFGGQAVTYALRTMNETWDHWHAHDFGTGAAICGAGTHRVDGARWRQVRIPATNPLLVGSRPGEIFLCQGRQDVRSETILALAPFSPVWALPGDPAHADKRSALLVLLDAQEPQPTVDVSTRNRRAADSVRRWVATVNDAGRKRFALKPESDEAKSLWQRYRVIAKQLWRKMR